MNFCRSAIAVTLLLLASANVGAQEITRITDDGLIKITPQFINGGSDLVYSVYDNPYRVTLVRRNFADGAVVRVLPTVETHQFGGRMSADGKYLCWIRSLSNPQLEIVIVDLEAKTEAKYSPLSPRATARNPSFAPDNSRIVFANSGSPHGQQIASTNLKGKDFKLLTASAGINTSPMYSPDGKKIAFGSSRDGDLEIYVMNADGSDARRLTKSPRLDTHPVWSPDGKRLAFTSARDGNYEIYVMNADGSGQVNITRHPEKDDFAAFHPDGKRLVVVSERVGRFDLYMIELPSKVAVK